MPVIIPNSTFPNILVDSMVVFHGPLHTVLKKPQFLGVIISCFSNKILSLKSFYITTYSLINKATHSTWDEWIELIDLRFLAKGSYTGTCRLIVRLWKQVNQLFDSYKIFREIRLFLLYNVSMKVKRRCIYDILLLYCI